MLYGVVTAAFLFFKMQAMATGPVSLTSFIGCASLLISTGFGVFVLGEGASVLQTVGVAILMDGAATRRLAEKRPRKKIMEALVRRVLRVQRGGRYNLQASSALRVGIENQRDDVRRGAHIGASLHRHVVRRVGKAPPEADTGFGGRLPGRLPEYAGCVYNRLNIFLAGQLPSVVFCPTFNGSVILISTLCGLIFFKEKLKAQRAIRHCRPERRR